jgi:formylmethanofuran dehydrogenase subunit A
MLTRLAGGHVIDPANRRDGIGDIFICDGRIVDAPGGGTVDESYDISNKIVMAGAIDIHSHIAGSNETMGRLVLPEQRSLLDGFHPGHLRRWLSLPCCRTRLCRHTSNWPTFRSLTKRR